MSCKPNVQVKYQIFRFLVIFHKTDLDAMAEASIPADRRLDSRLMVHTVGMPDSVRQGTVVRCTPTEVGVESSRGGGSVCSGLRLRLAKLEDDTAAPAIWILHDHRQAAAQIGLPDGRLKFG
jgi:hypothetical protein